MSSKVYRFYENRKKFYALSIAIFVMTVIFAFARGINIAIEFKGGTLISYSYSNELAVNDISAAAGEIIGVDVTTTEGENFADSSKYIQLSFVTEHGFSVDAQQDLTASLQEKFPESNLALLNSNDIKPSIGVTFFKKCLVAVAFALVLLIAYIAVRFRKIGGWSAGVTGIVALLHDCGIVLATFIIFDLPIDANFMAVIMTILGFSINDTIVIYDRIRENKTLMGKVSLPELVNTSISQTFMRSLNTTIATIIAMTTVCVISIIYGIDSIFTFAFPLIIGLVSGSYSTICIAGPLWVDWQNKMKTTDYAGNKVSRN